MTEVTTVVVTGRNVDHLEDAEVEAEVVVVDEAMTKGDMIDGMIGIVTEAVVDLTMTTVVVVVVAGGVEAQAQAAVVEDMAADTTEIGTKTEAEVIVMVDCHRVLQALPGHLLWDTVGPAIQPMDMEHRLHRQLLP